mmetsp:Transcript_175262/g.556668  ORF Transcript_175262/g.556668 Transcript_175262/m.556668 type:complete len:359 (-) Transcript_175262:817-1893(-)
MRGLDLGPIGLQPDVSHAKLVGGCLLLGQRNHELGPLEEQTLLGHEQIPLLRLLLSECNCQQRALGSQRVVRSTQLVALQLRITQGIVGTPQLIPRQLLLRHHILQHCLFGIQPFVGGTELLHQSKVWTVLPKQRAPTSLTHSRNRTVDLRRALTTPCCIKFGTQAIDALCVLGALANQLSFQQSLLGLEVLLQVPAHALAPASIRLDELAAGGELQSANCLLQIVGIWTHTSQHRGHAVAAERLLQKHGELRLSEWWHDLALRAQGGDHAAQRRQRLVNGDALAKPLARGLGTVLPLAACQIYEVEFGPLLPATGRHRAQLDREDGVRTRRSHIHARLGHGTLHFTTTPQSQNVFQI